jgi:hypothetical protein
MRRHNTAAGSVKPELRHAGRFCLCGASFLSPRRRPTKFAARILWGAPAGEVGERQSRKPGEGGLAAHFNVPTLHCVIAPHPECPLRSQSDLSPRAGRGKAKRSRSRDALFLRARVFAATIPKTSPQSRPSSDRSGSGGPKHHDRARRTSQNLLDSPPATKEAERRETLFLNRRAVGAARGLQSALASRRSTAALVGRLSPPNSAPGHASWEHFCLLLGGSGTILWTAFRRRSRHLSTGVTRACLSQSRVSTPAPVIMPEG